jgi:hypothetical protein
MDHKMIFGKDNLYFFDSSQAETLVNAGFYEVKHLIVKLPGILQKPTGSHLSAILHK